MTAAAARANRSTGDRPERAVIDIGSNTVRMVVYSGPARAPAVWLNEKVTARLGRDLATSGKLPDKAIDIALAGLARFALILGDLDIADVRTVATAAVREASNGAAFVDQVQALGLCVQVLSGEEEALNSAMGVIGAFPGAHGVVADLGGGSLELVAIGQGNPAHGVSLPLGTLRLPPLRAEGEAKFRKAIKAELTAADWAQAHGGPLFLVGGTWRAFAAFAMHKHKYPLSDPHAYALGVEEADAVARKLADMEPGELTSISGISASRAAGLPDAAAMLRVVLAQLQPDGLVFSSWGLREGLLFSDMVEQAREQDPLLAGVAHFTGPRGASLTTATQIAGWTAAAAQGNPPGSERLRLAATMLAMAQWRLEPNMRLKHSIDWALDKRWLGLDHRGRALIAAALLGAGGKPASLASLDLLAAKDELHAAGAWGLAYRLCRRLGTGSRLSLASSRLTREGDALTLWVEPARRMLVSDAVESELARLADWLGCIYRIEA